MGRAPVRVWGKAPISWQHFLKIMHKYFVLRLYTKYEAQKALYNIFRGGESASTLPMPAGAHYNGETHTLSESWIDRDEDGSETQDGEES